MDRKPEALNRSPFRLPALLQRQRGVAFLPFERIRLRSLIQRVYDFEL